ncbi:MAG: hypothetical protein IKY83_11545 [Proteobacteria bacterium]|nr:hypothetical protein [Pseudomonadota bacterium]
MKRFFLIMFAFATLATLSSCSRKAPDVSLLPDCHQSCQEFTNFIEEITPLKCNKFEGSAQNLCHLLVQNGNLIGLPATLAISDDFFDKERKDSLKGRPVYQFADYVPGRIILYDGLSQDALEKQCYESYDNKLPTTVAEFDDLSDQDIEKIRNFISKYIEITNKADTLEIRDRQTENMSNHERREIFEDEFGINPNNIQREKGKFVDEIRKASNDLPRSVSHVRYLDLSSANDFFQEMLFYYAYIALKSKYSNSSKTLKNKPDLLKDIEKFSNAYFNRFVRYFHQSYNQSNTYNYDYYKNEIREHILSAVMAFVISEDRLPSSNEEIMSTLYLSMPFNDLERIAISLQNYSMLNKDFLGIKFSKNDLAENLKCNLDRNFSDFGNKEKEILVFKYLISSYSCQYIDIQHKDGMITAIDPGWDNKIGTKDDIVIFEYDEDRIMSYIRELKAATPEKKISQ